MPVLFVGHGSPLNAIEDNAWSRAMRGIVVPRPRAVLAISAHWYVDGTHVTAQQRPPTIHDFGGFPPELYEVQYPAPGEPALAARVAAITGAALSTEWGLDHGTWSVLCHMIPQADVPVVQLSMDRNLAAAGHLELGRKLASLRDEGVLILASGNITHNLRHAFTAWRSGDVSTPDWAANFDRDVAAAIQRGDMDWLADALETEQGRASHPSADHYLPLLYAAGAADEGDAVSFPVTGFDMGSLSMRSVRLDATS